MENNFFDPLSDETIKSVFYSWKSDITPQNGEVPDPHQPRPKPPLIAGHGSFRPYAEPILKPRPPEWEEATGPLYNPFEKPYQPKEAKEPKIFNSEYDPAHGYNPRIITPSMSSTKDLFKQEVVEKDSLKEMLPPGSKVEDYLPAIQWAIKLTTWSHKAEIKCKKLYDKLKKQTKKWLGHDEIDVGSTGSTPEYGSVKPEDLWYSQISPEAEKDYEQSIKAALLNPGKSPADVWQAQTVAARPAEDGPSGWHLSDANDEIFENLRTAYKGFQNVLDDCKKLGLLQFQNTQTTEVKPIIRNWSQLYDLFTHTSVETYANDSLVYDIRIRASTPEVFAEFSHLHRLVQGLPPALLAELPMFPDLNDTTLKSIHVFCKYAISALSTTSRHLREIIATYVKESVTPLSDEEVVKVDTFRKRMHDILSKKQCNFATYFSMPGPAFTAQDLLTIPASVALKAMTKKDFSLPSSIDPKLFQMMLTQMSQPYGGAQGTDYVAMLTPTYEQMTDQQVIDAARSEYYDYLVQLGKAIEAIVRSRK